jgi:hypothetical protein
LVTRKGTRIPLKYFSGRNPGSLILFHLYLLFQVVIMMRTIMKTGVLGEWEIAMVWEGECAEVDLAVE